MSFKFNLTQMKARCLADIKTFVTEGTLYCSDGGKGDECYIYRQTESKVLAVAHLDTVQSLGHFHQCVIDKERYVLNAQLDDRLGAHIILDILPSLGITTDILLTDGEERGQSTAKIFDPLGKEYNWIFMFDRSGTDVVGYDYQSIAWESLMKENGFEPGHGSYSCIADLTRLGVWGFNFGTGYYHNHDRMSCVNLAQLARMLEKFVPFYHKYKDEKLVYTPSESPRKSFYRGAYYDDYDWYHSQGRFNDWRGRGQTQETAKSAYDWENEPETIWDRLTTPDDKRVEREARTVATTDGHRPYRDKINCDGCGFQVWPYEYFYSLEMCLDCFDKLMEDAEKQPTNAGQTALLALPDGETHAPKTES